MKPYLASIWIIGCIANVLLSPSAKALPAGVPNTPCSTISNPQPGALCYQIVKGGGKASAGGGPQSDTQIIQATEPEWEIADVMIVETSRAGTVTGPTANLLSRDGQASVVRVASDKVNETKRLSARLKVKVDALVGPAKIAAEQELKYLNESINNFENSVTTSMSAGQGSGKYSVVWSASSRKCGTFNADTCGSWVWYDAYVVRRYVGNPMLAYSKVQQALQAASQKIDEVTAKQAQEPPVKEPIINKQEPKQNAKELAQKQCFNMFFANHKALAQCIQLVNMR